MTNKEAIERLEYIKTHHTDPEDYELFDLAIKALNDVDRLEDENHENFVKSQHIISMLVEENKKLRGEKE